MGSNDQSWGWDLGRNKLFHDSKNNPAVTYPTLLKPDETFIVPDKFLGKLQMVSEVVIAYQRSELNLSLFIYSVTIIAYSWKWDWI